MYIQQVSGVQKTPSCRALFFTKTPVIMVDKTAEFLAHEENVKETTKGIRYLEDTDISKDLKKRFENSKFVQEIAKKYETFIWYVQSKNLGVFSSWAKIMCVKDGEQKLSVNYVIGKSEATPRVATENMFTALKNEDFIAL